MGLEFQQLDPDWPVVATVAIVDPSQALLVYLRSNGDPRLSMKEVSLVLEGVQWGDDPGWSYTSQKGALPTLRLHLRARDARIEEGDRG